MRLLKLTVICLLLPILMLGTAHAGRYPLYENELHYGDYVYTLTENGEATIVDIEMHTAMPENKSSLIWDDGIMTIPTSINGHTVTAIGDYAFSYRPCLIEATIPGTVKRIGDGAFLNCVNLEKVILSNGVCSIGSYAFEGCSIVCDLAIPESVTEIGENPFLFCDGLDSQEGLSVSENNARYRITDGFLFDASLKKLITCPSDIACGQISIPSYIKEISECAFLSCDQITDVTISMGIESIRSRAFAGCWNMQRMTIPSSVLFIEEDVFRNTSDKLILVVEEGSYAHSYAIEHEMKFQFYDAGDKGTMENEKKTALPTVMMITAHGAEGTEQ